MRDLGLHALLADSHKITRILSNILMQIDRGKISVKGLLGNVVHAF